MKRQPSVSFVRLASACLLAVAAALPARADSVTEIAQLQGWVNSNGGSNEATPLGNTYTGNDTG